MEETVMINALQVATQIVEDEITPQLCEYIQIPNVSPNFDPDWEKNGHMQLAVAQFEKYALRQRDHIPGIQVQVLQLPGLTPVIFIEVPETKPEVGTVLLYGHLDKQPPMEGWDEGLGPWTPVIRGDKLYGRGGADDGYAMFASLAAIRIAKLRQQHHGRLVILIEASEESGSIHLKPYIDAYRDLIGHVNLVVCLDSGCGDYEHLYNTTSLRGLVSGMLTVKILTEGVHSGSASGIVPDSALIAHRLIARLSDVYGVVTHPRLLADVPLDRQNELMTASKILGKDVYNKFPWVEGAGPQHSSDFQLLLRGTWQTTVTPVGVRGFPALEKDEGNVLRPSTAYKLSFRLPPTMQAEEAFEIIKEILEADSPCGAHVSFERLNASNGWNGPPIEPWLIKSVSNASFEFFGQPSISWGEGGTIPLMGQLNELFPDAQFLITGLLGPGSNAHGPNEFAHLPTMAKLIACVANVIADHADRY